MASVVIAGDTSGSVSVTVPATAGSNTITLPAVTGTAVISGQNSAITAGTVNAGGTNPFNNTLTSVDFTGIPSWVKRITVMFSGVSTNGSSNPQIQLGTGSTPTYTTSGYQNQNANTTTTAAGASANATSGFVFGSGSAANTLTGSLVLTNITGNTWVGNGSLFFSTTAMGTSVGGIALGAALTAIRITTVNGLDTFDAGTINILYE